MIANPESLVPGLRSLSGIKDVDIVTFPSGKELWIVLRAPVDIEKLRKVTQTLGYTVTKIGWFPSKLPRSLGEMIWDGTTCMIAKSPEPRWKLKFAADSNAVASIMKDLATGDTIYKVNDGDGLKILQEYLKS